MHVRPPTALAWVAMAAALVGSGCRESVGPVLESLACPSAAVPLCEDAAIAAAAREAIDDAATRLAPVLSTDSRTALEQHLAAITEHVRNGRVSDARAELDRARALVGEISAAADAADAAAIELSLDYVATALGLQ